MTARRYPALLGGEISVTPAQRGAGVGHWGREDGTDRDTTATVAQTKPHTRAHTCTRTGWRLCPQDSQAVADQKSDFGLRSGIRCGWKPTGVLQGSCTLLCQISGQMSSRRVSRPESILRGPLHLGERLQMFVERIDFPGVRAALNSFRGFLLPLCLAKPRRSACKADPLFTLALAPSTRVWVFFLICHPG